MVLNLKRNIHMRCPKCGFISFDHLDNCLKCNKELKGVAGTIHGTVFNVQAPSFLKIQAEPEKKSFGDIAIDSELEGGEFDLQDPDLEILLDEEEEEASGKASSLQFDKEEDELEISPGESFELSLDTAKEEDEEGISIDLGQFQNDLDDEKLGLGDVFGGKKEGGKVSRDFPEELADMSDLSPPHQKTSPSPVRKPAGMAEASEDFDLSLDLDLNGLAIERPAAMPAGKAAKEKKTENKAASLSLEDIDLSPAVKPGSSPRKGPADAMNMDEELNFDLDLGGLSIHKEDKR